MLVLVRFLLGQVGSLRCWGRSAVQAGKWLRGMLNDFSIPPCGSTRGRGGTWAAGGGSSQGLALAVRGRLHSPATNLLPLQGLGGWCGAAARILAVARN